MTASPYLGLLGAGIGAVSGGVGGGLGTLAFNAVGQGFWGGVLGGAVGGASAGATSGLLYQAAGYHVDIGQAALAGAAGGAVGDIFGTINPIIGGMTGGGVAAAVSGGDPAQGALFGIGAALVAGVINSTQSTGQKASADGMEFQAKDAIILRPGSFLGKLLAFITADPGDHGFAAHGNGLFSDSNTKGSGANGVHEFNGGDEYYDANIKGREYVKISGVLNVDLYSSFADQHYGLWLSHQVCTTYLANLSGGTLYGLTPGQMYLNFTNGGYSPGSLYYNFGVYGNR